VKKLIDYGRDDHPADDPERAQVAWAVTAVDDCEECADLRVVVTVEEVGRRGLAWLRTCRRPRPSAWVVPWRRPCVRWARRLEPRRLSARPRLTSAASANLGPPCGLQEALSALVC
jgi:hypothetical protein